MKENGASKGCPDAIEGLGLARGGHRWHQGISQAMAVIEKSMLTEYLSTPQMNMGGNKQVNPASMP